MNLNIYNGFKINEDALDNVIANLLLKKEKFIEIIDEKIKEEIIIELISNYYNFFIENFLNVELNNNDNQSAVDQLIKNTIKNKDNLEKIKNSSINISICLFPIKQTMENTSFYLMRLLGDNNSLNDSIVNSMIWKNLNIEPYNYWENKCETENSDKIWKLRKKQWMNVLEKTPFIIDIKKEYKYECLYSKNYEEIKQIFHKNFDNVMKMNFLNPENVLKFYEEKFKEKLAYKSINVENKFLNEMSDEEKNVLYIKIREYIKLNKFTENEIDKIDNFKINMEKILKIEINFDSLFKTKKTVLEFLDKSFMKTNKIKV